MDISSIKNTLVVLKLLASSSFPQDKLKLIINHANAVDSVKEGDIANIVRQDIFWRIPYDEEAGASVQSGKPVVLAKPGARISQSILDLAAVLIGKEKAPQTNHKSGLVGRLLRK